MADFMQGLMGMFTPGAEGIGSLLSEEERKKIANQAMMTTAMKLLASGGRSAQPISLGQALGGAYLTGQEVMNQGVTNAAQNLLLRQKISEAQADADLQKKAAEIMGQKMPQVAAPSVVTGEQAIRAPGALGPTVAKAALIGQQVTPTQPQMTEADFKANQYEQLAALYAKSRDPAKSEIFMKLADRFRPQEEWSTTPQTGIVNGRPVQYVMSKRGGMKVLDVAPSPNEDKVDTGSEIIIRNKDTGKVIERIAKTMTPGEVASNIIAKGQLAVSQGQLGVAQSGQKLAQERFQFEKGKPQYVEGVGFVYPPATSGPPTQANAAPRVVPVPGAAKPPTEGQASAVMFGNRMQAAHQTINELEKAGTTGPSRVAQAAQSIPGIGGAAGTAANWMMASENQQKYEQAQREFINAVLRKESGAVIGTEEFDSAKKQYFPQIGDSAAVIEQKRQSRERAIQGMRFTAGPHGSAIGATSALDDLLNKYAP